MSLRGLFLVAIHEGVSPGETPGVYTARPYLIEG
jgi:hypothetical protein